MSETSKQPVKTEVPPTPEPIAAPEPSAAEEPARPDGMIAAFEAPPADDEAATPET